MTGIRPVHYAHIAHELSVGIQDSPARKATLFERGAIAVKLGVASVAPDRTAKIGHDLRIGVKGRETVPVPLFPGLKCQAG